VVVRHRAGRRSCCHAKPRRRARRALRSSFPESSALGPACCDNSRSWPRRRGLRVGQHFFGQLVTAPPPTGSPRCGLCGRPDRRWLELPDRITRSLSAASTTRWPSGPGGRFRWGSTVPVSSATAPTTGHSTRCRCVPSARPRRARISSPGHRDLRGHLPLGRRGRRWAGPVVGFTASARSATAPPPPGTYRARYARGQDRAVHAALTSVSYVIAGDDHNLAIGTRRRPTSRCACGLLLAAQPDDHLHRPATTTVPASHLGHHQVRVPPSTVSVLLVDMQLHPCDPDRDLARCPSCPTARPATRRCGPPRA